MTVQVPPYKTTVRHPNGAVNIIIEPEDADLSLEDSVLCLRDVAAKVGEIIARDKEARGDVAGAKSLSGLLARRVRK